MNCFSINISNNYNPIKHKQLWYYITILMVMTIYYIIINLKYIQIIKHIYPPLFDFIDKYNGCIKSEKGDKNSVSIWYIIYLSIYIIIYSFTILYIYINISNMFNTLGEAIYVFIIMFVFLFIIINRIYFYDKCFTDPSADDNCFKPGCIDPKPYWDFEKSKCVSSSTPTKPTKPPKPPENDEFIWCSDCDYSSGATCMPIKECHPAESRGGNCSGSNASPKPICTRTPAPIIPIQIGESISNAQLQANKLKKEASDKFSNAEKFVSSSGLFGAKPIPTTEGFALLNNDKKINLKTNIKDVGNESYKADTLMKNLEHYLMNMYSKLELVVMN